MKFEAKGSDVFVVLTTRKREDLRGKSFKALEAVRAIKEGDHWRIDFAGHVAGAWLPWEAIDEVKYPDLPSAIKAAKTYYKSAQTLAR